MIRTLKRIVSDWETVANLCLGVFALPLVLMVGAIELRQNELPVLGIAAIGISLLLRTAISTSDARALGLVLQSLLAWTAVRLVDTPVLTDGVRLLLALPVFVALTLALCSCNHRPHRILFILPLGLAAFAVLSLLPLLSSGDSPFTGIPSDESNSINGLVAGTLTCSIVAASVKQASFPTARRLASALCISLFIAVSLGGVRTGWLLVTLEDAVSALEDGRFGDAERLVACVQEMNTYLENHEAAPARLSRRLLAHAGQDVRSLTTVAQIASSLEQWSVSAEAYASALQLQTGNSAHRLALSWSYFKSGDRERAIGTIDLIGDPEFAAQKSIVLATAGQIERAASVLASHPVLPAHFVEGCAVSGPMKGVLGAKIADVIHELGPYPGIHLLQEMGWAVFHNGSQIGRTGYRSPVDIQAVSGGGDFGWQLERIIIDGSQSSRMGRGYNIVVLSSSTGEVLQQNQFDTRELWGLGEGRALADTLAALPEGVIVVGTANHGARRGLPRRAWFALRGIGVRELPSHWGSHAFIGIKNAAVPGEEDLCDIGIAHVGAVARNINADVVADPHQLERFLRSKATDVAGGVAVYFSGYGKDDTVTVCRVLRR